MAIEKFLRRAASLIEKTDYISSIDQELCNYIKREFDGLLFIAEKHCLLYSADSENAGIIGRYFEDTKGEKYFATKSFVGLSGWKCTNKFRLSDNFSLTELYSAMNEIFLENLEKGIEKGKYEKEVLEKILKNKKEKPKERNHLRIVCNQ